MVNLVWTGINTNSSISDSTIQGWNAASGIPSCFRFVFQSPFANAWVLNTAYGGSVPMPIAPWTIIVSSASDPRFNWTVAGMAVPPFHQATVGHWGNESASEMGARMWHEILHCYDLPADSLQTSERAEFTEYLRTTGSSHYSGFASDPLEYERGSNHTQILIAFYIYLTHKYMECECFQLGCGEQPYVPPVAPYVPPYEPYVPPYDQPSVETPSTNSWLWVGGAVAGLLWFIL